MPLLLLPALVAIRPRRHYAAGPGWLLQRARRPSWRELPLTFDGDTILLERRLAAALRGFGLV